MPCCSQLCCVEATQSTHKNSFANECCQVLLHEQLLCAEASGGSNTYRRQPIASSILHGRSPWQPLRSAASAAISLQRQEQRTRRTCCENSAWLLHRGGRRYALPPPYRTQNRSTGYLVKTYLVGYCAELKCSEFILTRGVGFLEWRRSCAAYSHGHRAAMV